LIVTNKPINIRTGKEGRRRREWKIRERERAAKHVKGKQLSVKLPREFASDSADVLLGDEARADLHFHLSGFLLVPAEH
jgi:hypothetical protein